MMKDIDIDSNMVIYNYKTGEYEFTSSIPVDSVTQSACVA